MRASDCGISVDSAVDIAKESADIILLQKDLGVLERGIIEGRRTYGNLLKYLKTTVSSNFGNVLSVTVASLFLPFLPISALQLVLLSLVYEIVCIALRGTPSMTPGLPVRAPGCRVHSGLYARVGSRELTV